MQTRCHTTGSFHPKNRQPLALRTFPLAGIHPPGLDNWLTIDPVCIVYACAAFYLFLLCAVFVCASSEKQQGISPYNKQLNGTAGVHTNEGMCALHVCQGSRSITVSLSVGLRALRSPLLAAVHEEDCWRLLGFPHAPPEYKALRPLCSAASPPKNN